MWKPERAKKKKKDWAYYTFLNIMSNDGVAFAACYLSK